MDPTILMTVIGASFTLVVGILGYFLKIVHNDVRKNIQEAGKNKGKIELIEQKMISDKQHFEQTTQKEIRTMASNVNKLAKNVNTLVLTLVGNNLIDSNDIKED